MANIIIIGANRGIGLELAKLYHQQGDDVLATYRNSPGGLEELAEIAQRGNIDVTSQDSLTTLAEDLEPASVDRLVVVAGILESMSLDTIDTESIRRQFEVNAIGPLQAVAALRTRLRPGSKVALITSRMGSIADNSSGGHYGYRMSKAALNMAGRSLAHDLGSDQITVLLLHPGFVRTDMTSGSGQIGPDESARGLADRIEELGFERSGSFYHQSGEELRW